MKHHIAKALFCAAALIEATFCAHARPVAAILIENVTILSPHLDQAQANMDVLVRDGRVLDVIKTGSDTQAETRIDGTGKFLIPGLIDSHVHLGHNPLVNHDDPKEHEALRQDYRRQLPRSFLYHGFTSVIDLDYSPERNGWLPGTDLAPDVYHCGRGVRVAGGYGPAFVPAEIAHKAFPNMVYEAQQSAHWPDELDPDLYSVDAAVRRVVQSGAICLKTYVESGFGGIFDWPSPGPETLSALSDAAHEQGLVVAVHANSAADWQRAIAGGADVIVHGLWHWNGDRREAGLTKEALSAVETAVSARVAVQPTVRVVEGEKSTLDWGLLGDSRMADILPSSLLNYLQSSQGRWSREFLLGLYRKHNPHPEIAPSALIDVAIRRVRDTMMTFHHTGGTLLLGTDTPAQDGIGNPPGLNGYLEMASWAEAGIPLETIFRSATLDNARAFNLDHELGSIEPGKQADLVLLNSSPLESVEAYDDIAVVFVNGKPVNRLDLSAQFSDPTAKQ